jgi:hypothetical protein
MIPARLLVTLALVTFLTPCAPARADERVSQKRTELDEAIDRGLLYLQRMQEPDGSWRMQGNFRGAGGPRSAVTGLAVMAFLSAGHVPGEGRYGETVERGVRFVLSAQKPNGLISENGSQEMYQHGICTLMLAEVAGMTEGKLADEIRKKLEAAVKIILRAQRQSGTSKGGWRYQIYGTDADISVTGWQLMALRAAKNLGCDVPPESIDDAVAFIMRCRDTYTGGFRYHPGGALTIACTGTSILGLEICGKELHASPEIQKAAAFILKNPPAWGQPHFFYSIYYCSQATFQLGGSYWEHYRGKLHEVLAQNQLSNGAWIGRDSDSYQGGPCYSTAMAILSMTVEYRYLPIYQRGEEPNEKK